MTGPGCATDSCGGSFRAVGGDLTDAIARVIGAPVELTCAGRTDKGVHARAQVVTFDDADARKECVARGAAIAAVVDRLGIPTVALRDYLVPGEEVATFSGPRDLRDKVAFTTAEREAQRHGGKATP